MKDLFKALKVEIIDALVMCASEPVGNFSVLEVTPKCRHLVIRKQDKDFYALYDLDGSIDLYDEYLAKSIFKVKPMVVASNWYLSASLIVDIFMLAIKNNYKLSDLVELDN